jgi:hypothetical protein
MIKIVTDNEEGEEPQVVPDAPADKPSQSEAGNTEDEAARTPGKMPDGKESASGKDENVVFTAGDMGETRIPLICGDEVEFNILLDKRTKRRRAIKMALVRMNPERERGVVSSIR